MNRILQYAKPYKKTIAMAMLFISLDVVCEILQPRLMAMIIGQGLQQGDMGYILKVGGLMILLAMLAVFCGICNSRFAARAGVGFAANLREGLFAKVQTFSFKNIDSFSTASLTTRLTNDVTLMQNTAIMCMRMVIRAPLMLVMSIFMVVNMGSGLGSVLVVVVPVLAIGLFAILSRALPRFSAMQKGVDRLNGEVRENLTNVRVVKSFVREEYEKEKFAQANNNLTEASLRAMNLVILNMPLMILVMNATILAILWLGGNKIIAGTMDVAVLTATISYVMQILMSLMMVSMIFVNLSRASASFKRVLEVLTTEVDLADPKQSHQPQAVRGEVVFDHVSFKYNPDQEEDILQDITFTAKPGQVVAILGGTGAGKSSLVQLIPRLYDTTQGQVLLDGVPVEEYPLEALREHVGMVLQKNELFSGTIAENLRWGNENATQEQLEEACKAAQAHDFITSFPNGYDTWLEQGGVNLSGGQKQRLCIARAMLKKPAVLILDDSTSAVDTATESHIRESFHTLLRDTTTFIIAQRISSVRDADEILVMDSGRIVANGTHDQLMETSVEYQEIYYSQMERKEGA